MNTSPQPTQETIWQESVAEYEGQHPRPIPPAPPPLERPGVVKVGNGAHLWLDVSIDPGSHARRARAYPQCFIVEREGNKDQRIEGGMSLDSIEALIQELTRVRESVLTQQRFLEQTAAYEKQQAEWDKVSDAFARHKVAEWERTQGY